MFYGRHQPFTWLTLRGIAAIVFKVLCVVRLGDTLVSSARDARTASWLTPSTLPSIEPRVHVPGSTVEGTLLSASAVFLRLCECSGGTNERARQRDGTNCACFQRHENQSIRPGNSIFHLEFRSAAALGSEPVSQIREITILTFLVISSPSPPSHIGGPLGCTTW
jgi:hypothetical protein